MVKEIHTMSTEDKGTVAVYVEDGKILGAVEAMDKKGDKKKAPEKGKKEGV